MGEREGVTGAYAGFAILRGLHAVPDVHKRSAGGGEEHVAVRRLISHWCGWLVSLGRGRE